MTADTALRLGKFFITGPEFWMNLQIQYDLTGALAAKPEIDGIPTYG